MMKVKFFTKIAISIARCYLPLITKPNKYEEMISHLKNRFKISEQLLSVKTITREIGCIFLFVLVQNCAYGQEKTSDYFPEKRYALVVGISQYENPIHNLAYSKKDAVDVQDALIKFGRFEKENVRLLVDNYATRENIRKIFEGWLKSETKKGDVVFIYFSGHGSQIKDYDGDEEDGLDECIIPFDFDNTDISSVITDDIFAYWIRNLLSDRIIIVFDNCYSGGAAKQKGVSLAGVKGNIGKDNFTRDIFQEIPRTGTSLLAASKSDQVSFESSDLKNGVFTHFFISSISASTDSNFNNAISPSEIYSAIRQKTIDYSRRNFQKEQEPIFIDEVEKNIELFYLPFELKDSSSIQNTDSLEYLINQENDLSKKIELYKAIYNTDPYNYLVGRKMADLYRSNEEYLKAIECYKILISNKNGTAHNSPRLISIIADLYMEVGNEESAVYYYLEAVKIEPKNSKSNNALANISLSNQDSSAAIQYLNNSITNQPLQKEAYLALFYIHLNQGNIDVSNIIITNSYKINPSDLETVYWFNQTQSFINKIPFDDSSYLSPKDNGRIKNYLESLCQWEESVRIRLEGKRKSSVEINLENLLTAISVFPYHHRFYQMYIKYVKDNKIDIDLTDYINNYLLYTKLDPDESFISKYIY